MSQFYVQLDDRRFVAKMARKLASTDDPKQWTTINLPTAKDIDFGVNFDKYQVDENGTITKGGDDAVTLGDVNTQLATALDTIKQQNDQLTQATATIKQLQQMITTQTMQQSKSDATIKQLQDLATQLTSQIAKLGKAGN